MPIIINQPHILHPPSHQPPNQAKPGNPSKKNSQIIVNMERAITNFALDIVGQQLDMIGRPGIDPRKGPQTQCLDALAQAEIVPAPDILLVGIGGPRVQRQADDAILHVDEALVLQQLHRVGLVGERFAAPRGGVLEVVVPAEEQRVFARVGAVVAAGLQVDFDLFEVAVAGFEVSVFLGVVVVG